MMLQSTVRYALLRLQSLDAALEVLLLLLAVLLKLGLLPSKRLGHREQRTQHA